MLRVRDLVVDYGRVTAVDGISFDVAAGEVVALIGANGAGKSSTLMAISGIVAYYEPDHTLEEIVFEVVSAVCTCGFSVGIVDELNTPSRWAMSVGMFLGRVGPFAFFAALVGITRAGRAQYRYPTESVNVY